MLFGSHYTCKQSQVQKVATRKEQISKSLLDIFIIVIIGCPILNCMIHYNVCNEKGKYCAILGASGNFCGRLELVIPLAHWAIGFKT